MQEYRGMKVCEKSLGHPMQRAFGARLEFGLRLVNKGRGALRTLKPSRRVM